MRLLHTADWHLGRSLHGAPLLEDQAHVLDEFVRLAAEVRPDLVVIAGDVFDRAVPPPDAVELLDEVLCRLVLDLKLPTALIAGNHDSPIRLAFGARLLEQSRLAVAGEAKPRTVFTLDDAWGPVAVCAVPYAEPAVVRQALLCEAADHAAALAAQVAGLPARAAGTRAVLVAHVFVQGGDECESERPLSVGGAGCVPLSAFDGFAYVALGHLHRPQAFDGGRVRYAGSLFPYSFAEAGQAKSASLVEIGRDGTVAVETVPLGARRRVREVRGRFADLLRAERSDDYVCAVLEDTDALLDPFGRLREVFPRLLDVKRPFYAPGGGPRRDGDCVLPTERDLPELFADFFGQVTGSPMSEAEREALDELVDAWQRAGREAA
jgi:DNA repair protein SbcD/Mre11